MRLQCFWPKKKAMRMHEIHGKTVYVNSAYQHWREPVSCFMLPGPQGSMKWRQLPHCSELCVILETSHRFRKNIVWDGTGNWKKVSQVEEKSPLGGSSLLGLIVMSLPVFIWNIGCIKIRKDKRGATSGDIVW